MGQLGSKWIPKYWTIFHQHMFCIWGCCLPTVIPHVGFVQESMADTLWKHDKKMGNGQDHQDNLIRYPVPDHPDHLTICYGTAASGWMPCYGLWKWNLKMNIKRRDGESFPLCHQMSWNMKTSVGKNKMTCCCLTEKGVGLKIISRTWNCMMSLMIWSWKQKLSVFRIEGSPHCWENYANSPKMLLNNL